MQNGGLNPNLSKEIAEQRRLNEARDVILRAYQQCIDVSEVYIPNSKYTITQRATLCNFVVENREYLVQEGLGDTPTFMRMFNQMVDNLMEKEDIPQEKAFLVVLRASYRMIGMEPDNYIR